MMLIALMLQAAVPEASAFDYPWLRIGRSPALMGISEEVVVARITHAAGTDTTWQHVDRARLVRRDGRGGRLLVTTLYADARTCPGMAALPSAVAHFPMPHAVSPSDTPGYIVMDGISYTVAVDVSYGQASRTTTFESNVGTPLATWVEARLAALKPCWTPA